ncbi:carbohydrate ABC transporter permease [bacterium]|nr:MAG: carbohydrate ABC transporter permease [bacterium]
MRRVPVFVLLLVFVGTMLLPFLWTIASSFKTGASILGDPWALPKRLGSENYLSAWREAGIGSAFGNSLIVTIASMAILIPIGSMAAYVLTKYVFPGSKLIMGGFLTGMMFPHFLVVVPLFLMLRDMSLLDTRTGLVLVYVAYSLSFTIFVLSGFFEALPDELAEAAMLDGCSHAGTFWKVMFPLARPGVVIVAIFNAIGLWNEYGLALVLLPSEANRTLPLGIANLTMTQQYQSDWGALFAGLVIVMLPVLALYWAFRDKVHEAMLAGAVKG